MAPACATQGRNRPRRVPLECAELERAKLERLRQRKQFLQVAGSGRKAAVPSVVVQVLRRQDLASARVGFTVTKKVGNAVVRNRTKRRLRAAARLLLAARPCTGHDLVLIGRDSTRHRRFDLLLGDLARALDKAGVA